MDYNGYNITDLVELFDEDIAKNWVDMVLALKNSPPPEFDMRDYFDYDIDPGDQTPIRGIYNQLHIASILGDNYRATGHTCGSVCCVLGTAAFHGVGTPKSYDSWCTYALRSFGAKDNIWEWNFSDAWSYTDNTLEGAIFRTETFIKYPKMIIEMIDGYNYPAEDLYYVIRDNGDAIIDSLKRKLLEKEGAA